MSHLVNDAMKEEKVYIKDVNSNKSYLRGKFLGKGGFAKCYEVFVDDHPQNIYACKIVPKALLAKQHQKEKMASEVSIHRSLCHINIVKFYDFFEDSENVYVILELCTRRSLLELHKRRRTLTEPEVRYYMKQIVEACVYLHDNNVIHRDLKLGNLFIDENLVVKIGDFGLATKLAHDGERKTTLCGTPNYIAPEILTKTGHSFEVDVWSLGCILYTLCVGQPPFETSNLKDTYNKIKSNDYYIPSKVCPSAQQLIVKLLHSDPSKRPKMIDILHDDYFYSGFIPEQLPVTSLTSAPRFSVMNQEYQVGMVAGQATTTHTVNSRQILQEVKKSEINRPKKTEQIIPEMDKLNVSPTKENFKFPLQKPIQNLTKNHAIRVVDNTVHFIDNEPNDNAKPDYCEPTDFYIGDLKNLLVNFISLASKNPVINPQLEDAEDPSLTPFCWLCRWVDYTDKYGLGYQTNDGCVGVNFNDKTHLVSTENGGLLMYVNEKYEETIVDSSNQHLFEKKLALHFRFKTYMNDNLVKTGGNVVSAKVEQMTRLHYVVHWFRGKEMISFLVNCGILQMNFFEDHVKIIICSRMEAVTYISPNSEFKTYKFSLLLKHGCSKDLLFRLKYALTVLQNYEEQLVNSSSKPNININIKQPNQLKINADQPQQHQMAASKMKQQINQVVLNYQLPPNNNNNNNLAKKP